MLSVVVLVVAIVMFLGGIGVGSVFFTRAPAPPRTTLIVAVQAPFPPFMDFNTSVDIGFQGFEVDILQRIGTELNRTLVLRQFSSFTTLLAETGRGAVDMASASITITAARNDTMDFSNPYFRVDQGFLAQKSNSFACTNNVCTPQQLADKIIAVQQATTSQDWIEANVKPLMANPGNQIKVFQQVEQLITALQSGSVDLVMIDSITAKSFANDPANNLKLAGLVVTNESYGFAVANGDPQGLVSVINRVLAKIRSDGTYQTLITKWFPNGV
jgi:polar amino acid transport system substrate-binding protein